MHKVTQVSFWKRWYVQTTVALVISILVTAGTHLLSEPLSLKENIARVFGIWVVGMIFQIANSLHSFHVDRLEIKHVLGVINKTDYLLLELQSKFREIAARPLSGKPNQVFIDYCLRSLEQTLSVAKGAARGELKVHDHHFDTVDAVMAAFKGCKDRTFRCVWLIEDGALFDDSWGKYMEYLVKLGQSRSKNKQVQIRILFIVENDLDDLKLLKRRAVKIVLGFVSGEKRFEGRLISRSDYDGQLRDAGLDKQCLDFGVYGDHLLFRTTSYEPTNMGVFSVDPAVIQKYSRVHDVAMDAPKARNLPSGLPEKISLKQFLNCDKADVVSKATAGGGRGVGQ